MTEWSNFLSVAHDLENKAHEVEMGCSYQLHTAHKADEIRYVEGVFVGLMNEIITFVQASSDDASEYDYLVRDYEHKKGNDIPFDDVERIYDAFLILFNKYFREREKTV